MTVYENLAFPLRAPVRKLSNGEVDRRVREIAHMVRIDHKLENRSTHLSGGEMQRVAIGRALVRQPAIYLMDEPLSSLDAKLRAELRLELKRIQKELNSTLLYVTHDQIEAMTMADRIGIVAEGRLMQVGTPREIYGNPANLHVAARLGQPHINLLPADLLPGGNPPAGTKTIGARTEHLDIVIDKNTIRVRDHKLVTLADPYLAVRPGDRISLTLRDPLYFDSSGQRLG
jgi:multiple sugar transport system ATP-binding protein